jgi:hypothetical protein
MPGRAEASDPGITRVALDVEPGWPTSPPGQPMVSQDMLTLTLVHHLPDLRLAQCQTLVSATTWSRRKSECRPPRTATGPITSALTVPYDL